jgi:hypothetical protein
MLYYMCKVVEPLKKELKKMKIIYKENGKIVKTETVKSRDYEGFLARKAHKANVFKNKKKYDRKKQKKIIF